MQNVRQTGRGDAKFVDKVQAHDIIGNITSTSTPQSTNSTPTKSETETFSENPRFMSEASESDEESVSEVESFMIDQEFEDDPQVEAAKFLLNPDEDRTVDPETQARLEALLQAAGIGQLTSKDGKALGDPEVLRRLTSSVSCALDEAAAALTRMRSDNQGNRAQTATTANSQPTTARPQTQGGASTNGTNSTTQQPSTGSKTSLVEACTDGDVGTVKKLLTEGRSVHETSEEGESLLSLACSAGYFELAQVLLAMHANVEDRGIKGECTPLMEAASAGHLDIVRLLVHHGADVNAQSTSGKGNTPLMYACAGGHTEVVKFLLENGANVEDHNENGHTPLMEAASAGHVGLAKILLQHGAGINTHSNEFKESALTLACYKGHLDMVRFLLEAGADQEHKTDEMHTALMEASMDGHVEVARLLLDSGAQVNMPTDSFESPLTLAACGGHVDLAMLLIERGANIEEVNDEGYTPLMEAAREGHEEMVHLLLGQGANINAQTDETQETALTLACCGGFTEVADILLKGGADIELGASTPLMEAAQEGHLDLVRFLLEYGANVNAQTQTSDTALTYACENGHTDVADLLLQYNADLEHESEGGRTPLMKACRAGHLCTVQFLISKGANVRKQTTNNDHTPLSLACAGGHLSVVELLLQHNADPNHKLKDNSTMLIEAAKGGHTNVVQLLLDFPHSMQPMMFNQHGQPANSGVAATMPALPANLSLLNTGPEAITPIVDSSGVPSPPHTAAILQEVPEAVRIAPLQVDLNSPTIEVNNQVKQQVLQSLSPASLREVPTPPLCDFEDEMFTPIDAMEFLKKEDPNNTLIDYIKNRKKFGNCKQKEQILEELNVRLHINKLESQWVQKYSLKKHDPEALERNQKRAILEELHRVEQELQGKQQQQQQQQQQTGTLPNVFHYTIPHEGCPGTQTNTITPLNFDLALQQQKQGLNVPILSNSTTMSYAINNNLTGTQQQPIQVPYFTGITGGATMPPPSPLKLSMGNPGDPQSPYVQSAPVGQPQPAFYFAPLGAPPTASSVGMTHPTETPLSAASGTNVVATATPGLGTLVPPATTAAPLKFTTVAEVSQSTAINDRPKVKPIKKEGKNLRKQQQQASQQHQQSSSNQSQPPNNPTQPPSNPTHLPSNQQLGNLQPSGNLQQVPSNQNSAPSNQQQTTNIQQQGAIVTQQQVATAGQIQQSPAPPKTFNIFADQQLQMPQPNLPTSQSQQHSTLQLVKMKGIPRKALSDSDIELPFLKDDQQESLLTASILQQFHNSLQQNPPVSSPQKTRLEAVYDPSQENNDINATTNKLANLEFEDFQGVDDVVQTLEVQPYPTALDENMIATLTAAQQVDLQAAAAASSTGDLQRVDYFAVPTSQGTGTAQVPVHALFPYDYLPNAGMQEKQVFQAGFQAGFNLSSLVNQTIGPSPAVNPQQPQQQYLTEPQPQPNGQQASCGHIVQPQQQTQHSAEHQQHHCQHQPQNPQQNTQQVFSNHVQAATQTSVPANSDSKKIQKVSEMKFKRSRPVKHHNNGSINIQSDQHYKIDHNSAITQYNTNQIPCPNSIISPCMDVDSETESNHDTALTLACAGGHEELVELLISRGADIEHRDKKGFTPLILAATAGHEKVVEILLNNNADIEAQSERTKDTPLSLACSGGRYEVVELLLNRGANKEHRNVSDYTPLSLAASGGYVNIIKLLLSHGAEINSRTGSKLGISPLMLAAMNGHTAAVKLLLDMGSDINAQIETNRNTALTLACFQGRHEVVSLLLDRKANVEHRAKTGLTPLMEAASGGYVDVGRVLLDKGADVNATPVPSSRDTALTIAADKGHVRFVELLLVRGAQVEVKNKKGNSPLWLAANGGHLPVVEMLYKVKADIDSQDNRKVSCLMAAFRKGHVKVVKWMVLHVAQFPSDQEMMRYIATISDKELLEKCHECVKIIRAAKETQAARANKNATILLEELESEKSREESKKLAAAKRRERKKKKRLEKKEERRKLLEENKKNENYDDKENDDKDGDDEEDEEKEDQVPEVSNTPRSEGVTEEGDSGIDANSQGSCSSNDIKTTKEKRKNKKNKKSNPVSNKKEPESPAKTNNKACSSKTEHSEEKSNNKDSKDSKPGKQSSKKSAMIEPIKLPKSITFEPSTKSPADRDDFEATGSEVYISTSKTKKSEDSSPKATTSSPKSSSKREEGWKEVVRKSSVQTISESGVKKVSVPLNAISRVIGRGGSNINAIRAYTGAHIEVEKQGKGQGERIITIKGSGDTTKQAYILITALIKDPEMDIMSALSKTQKVPPTTTTLWDKTQIATKKNAGKANQVPVITQPVVSAHPKTVPQTSAPTTTQARFTAVNTAPKYRNAAPTSVAPTRGTAPRLVAQAEKTLQAQNVQVRMPTSSAPASRPTPAKVITTSANQTFAAKLTESSTSNLPVSVNSGTVPHSAASAVHKHNNSSRNGLQATLTSSGGTVSPQPPMQGSLAGLTAVQRSPTKTARPPPTGSAPPLMQQVHTPALVKVSHSQSAAQPAFGTLPQTSQAPTVTTASEVSTPRMSSSTPNRVLQGAMPQQKDPTIQPPLKPSQYSLFEWDQTDVQVPITFAAPKGNPANQPIGTGHKFIDQEPPPQVDASKAPGYRGGGVSMCSPVSSKASSSSTTPPNLSANNSFGQNYQEPTKTQNPLPPIGSRPQVSQSQNQTQSNQDFMTFMDLNKAAANLLNFNNDNHLLQNSFNPIPGLNFSQPQPQGPVNMQQQSSNMSRLNPKAPEYSGYNNPMQSKSSPHVFNGFQQQMNVPTQGNMFAMKGMDNFHRAGMAGSSGGGSSQNRSWMQMPQPFSTQSEQLMSGLAGMTIQNLQAKFHNAEQGLENGAELGLVHSSPNMSPNMNPGHGMHPEAHFGGIEDRKPQPIGTERARKAYSSGMEQNWALNNEKPAKWGTNLAEYGMRPQPPLYTDDVMDFPRPIQMDNFMNQPPFVNYQQPPIGAMRHDFIPDLPKLDLSSWDNNRPLSDLQEKPHGWTNQWNK